MNKLSIALIAFAVALTSSFAGTVAATNAVKKVRKHTPEELAAMVQRSRMRHTGGEIRKPGTANGMFVILNAQKTVSQIAANEAAYCIDEQVHVQTIVANVAQINPINPLPAIKANGGSLGVVVMDSPDMPALLTAPESGWAVVNVRPLVNADTNRTILRTRREILRAFALIGGCTFMSRAAILLRDIAEPKELDAFIADDYGIDTMMMLERSLPQHGIMPWYQTTYKKACQEGWAPQPTNEFQKAIWDKVHQLPTEPIKIMPETKPVKD